MILFVILFGAFAVSNAFECPSNESELFPDPEQCDKYYSCADGKATANLCPDGLVFDKNITRLFKCDHPFKVDCGKRLKLQEPQGTGKFCPRKNGVFYHPDKSVCNAFFTCDDGLHTEGTCVNGLHFHEPSGECVWPDVANREECIEKKTAASDGFNCPKEKTQVKNGQVDINPKFPHPDDCQKFYVCVNGIEARLLTCDEPGEVFNEEKLSCGSPADVPGCEHWFDE